MSRVFPQVPLSDLLVEQRVRVGTFDADELPLLGVSNTEGLHRSGKPRLDDMGRYFRVERDWFAYNPMRINVGSIGWASHDGLKGVISPDYVVFSCGPKILPHLVYLFLRSRVGLDAIGFETAGSVRERLYFDALGRIEFPLPPLAEQRRIVTRIDQLADKIAEARKLRTETNEALGAMMSSAMRHTFGDAQRDDWVPLTDYVEDIENGWSPACHARRVENGEWGVLKVGAVSFGTFDPNQNKALPEGLLPLPELEIKPHDFLMSRANTVQLVGACAVVSKAPPRLLLCDKIFRFKFRDRPNTNLRFWDWLLKSPALRTQIERGASGTSPTMKNISKPKILALRVPRIKPDEQLRIMTHLENLSAKAESVKQLQQFAAAELNALLPSILDRAFKGDL